MFIYRFVQKAFCGLFVESVLYTHGEDTLLTLEQIRTAVGFVHWIDSATNLGCFHAKQRIRWQVNIEMKT